MKDHWIKSPLKEKYAGAISFVKCFPLGGIAAATVAVSSVGLYELRVNGKKVGHRVLTPGFTSYNKRGIQCQEYDITEYLQEENSISITVAPGWAVGHMGYAGKENLYADYGTTADSNVAIVPPGIESKILGGNNYQSDYTRQTEIFRNNILRTFVTPQSQAGNEKSNTKANKIGSQVNSREPVTLPSNSFCNLSSFRKNDRITDRPNI